MLERHPEAALLLPLHRNPTVREPLQELLGEHPRVTLTEPLDYDRLVAAMKRCTLLLTDSGGLQEEALPSENPFWSCAAPRNGPRPSRPVPLALSAPIPPRSWRKPRGFLAIRRPTTRCPVL